MPDRSIPDHLVTERLYGRVAAYVMEVADSGNYNPDELRRRLDPVLTMGKAIGRRSALDELRYPSELEDLRKLRSHLSRLIGLMTDSRQAMADTVEAFAEYTAYDRQEASANASGFRDRLIDGWLEMVDGDVPRETSSGRIELPSEEELMRRIFPEHHKED